jgi:hypothetical protein
VCLICPRQIGAETKNSADGFNATHDNPTLTVNDFFTTLRMTLHLTYHCFLPNQESLLSLVFPDPHQKTTHVTPLPIFSLQT